MSDIEKLIDDALSAGNFCNEKDAETFLIQYPQDGQCALITAARIGKDLSNDLPGYYDAFMRCAENSGYDLANF